MEMIRLGISACLLGERVRYDGSHSLDRFLRDTLGQFVEYVPVCPEVECGLPVPREPMHLEGDPASPRLMTSRSRRDLTHLMVKWAKKRMVELKREKLCGFIFKSDSPSSGMEKVKVYNEKGIPIQKGIGIFAKIFMDHFPLIPVEDEKRIHDPSLRANFIERVFTLKRWREVLARSQRLESLMAFHTQHKFLILSHSPRHEQVMERLLAKAKGMPLKEVFGRYQNLLIEALKLKATPKKNANVLKYMVDYFEKRLSPGEKKELLEFIDHYKKGYLPLIVPIVLLRHYVRKYPQPFLEKQIYLYPHPLELQLKNHV